MGMFLLALYIGVVYTAVAIYTILSEEIDNIIIGIMIGFLVPVISLSILVIGGL
jgi:hypothetical protein